MTTGMSYRQSGREDEPAAERAARWPKGCASPWPGSAGPSWSAASAWSARTGTTWSCASAELPARGYASHGESWSLALALRLAAYDLLRSGGDDPVLMLDDVFAELDSGRRESLAGLVSGAEQVLVTAAVPADVPALLAGQRFEVSGGAIFRA